MTSHDLVNTIQFELVCYEKFPPIFFLELYGGKKRYYLHWNFEDE